MELVHIMLSKHILTHYNACIVSYKRRATLYNKVLFGTSIVRCYLKFTIVNKFNIVTKITCIMNRNIYI